MPAGMESAEERAAARGGARAEEVTVGEAMAVATEEEEMAVEE